MIQNIIDVFKTQAREHKTIKAFYYNRNYEKGSGKDMYPLFWLEDPIYGQNRNNLFVNSVNFCILFIPNEEMNVVDCQKLAFSIGLNMIERIKKYSNESGIEILPDWDYMTLRDYYDDDAAGCRFSLNFHQLNMQNLCLIDEQFDIDKEFESSSNLPELIGTPSNSCEEFINKFPDFNIKTRKSLP